MTLAIEPKLRNDPNLYQFFVEAEGLGRYQIDVSVPVGAKPNQTFPLVLVTDGNLHFGSVAAHLNVHGVGDGFFHPPSVVVGVGYPQDEGMAKFYARRNFDFYGDWDMTDELGRTLHGIFTMLKAQDKKPELEMYAGGAPRFSAFLRDELLPGLAKHFPIDLNGRHMLVGHSSGGHYVLRELYDPKSAFSRFISISPGFGAGGGAIERMEAEYAASHDDMERDLFICCGQQEVDLAPMFALCRFGSGVTWVAEQFAIRQWKSARIGWEIMNNEDHGSVFDRAIAAGFRSINLKRPGVHPNFHLPYGMEEFKNLAPRDPNT